MNTGVIKFFNRKKGFGFIIIDGSEREIFFHATGLINKRKMNSGDRVVFEEGVGKFGVAALNVKRLDEPSSMAS